MNKVIIFSSARSGGNLLDSMFNQYSGTKSFGEFFSRRLHSSKDSTIFQIGNFLELSPMDTVNIIENEYSDYILLTFRFHEAHMAYSYNKDIYDNFNNFKKIILYRENFLNKCVSLSIASASSKWHFTDNDKLPAYSNYSIFYNPKNFNKFFENTKNYYNDILSRYDDVLVFKYEDLIKMNNLDDILFKLGLNLNKINNEINTKHINKSDDGYLRVINKHELGEYKLIFDGKKFI
jgi:hypothetical protein